MGFKSKLHQTEQKIRKSFERALGHETTPPLDDIRREILQRLGSRIRRDREGPIFPFGKVAVLLQAPTKGLREALQTAFLDHESLKTDIIRNLEGAKARCADELEITVEFHKEGEPIQAGSDPPPCYEIHFLKPEPVRRSEIPATNLLITKGSAESPAYRMKKERILIGCLPEVFDREGRMIRKNDVVFPENGGDINATVDSVHARIWFEFEKPRFHIMDEGSRYGTRIVRKGRSLDVPCGKTHGLILRSGDEIHCGQASLQFEVLTEPDSK
jgi:hypothetical protein